jgi:hypothetical protein
MVFGRSPYSYFVSCIVVLLCGCIVYAPAPSAPSSPRMPEIVLQVCAPKPSAKTAEIILYRSNGFLNLGFEFKHRPRGKTIDGQEVFETILDAPSPSHNAIGVQIESETPQGFFVFAIPTKYTADWSSWVVPIAEEHNPRREIDKFSYMRGKKVLEPSALKNAPRLRYRLEYQLDYSNSSRSSERYEKIPECS